MKDEWRKKEGLHVFFFLSILVEDKVTGTQIIIFTLRYLPAAGATMGQPANHFNVSTNK